jgi:hypothetical protein
VSAAPPAAARPDRLVLRGGSGWWLLGGSGAVAILLIVDAVVRGNIPVALRALPWLALALWLIWVVLVRPCIVVTRERLEIVNVCTRHSVPWDRIAHLTSRFQLRAELDDGRSLRSWGAPTAGIDRAPRSASRDEHTAHQPADPRTGRRGGSRAALPPVDLVIARWRTAAAERDDRAGRPTASSGGDVVSTVDWSIPAITAALVALVVVAVVV